MDGMAESEPTLSSACCAGPVPYRPIGQFWVIGRIELTSTGQGCSHQPGHTSQEFHISSAGASRTRALTTESPALYQLSYGTGNLVLCRIPYPDFYFSHCLSISAVYHAAFCPWLRARPLTEKRSEHHDETVAQVDVNCLDVGDLGQGGVCGRHEGGHGEHGGHAQVHTRRGGVAAQPEADLGTADRTADSRCGSRLPSRDANTMTKQ